MNVQELAVDDLSEAARRLLSMSDDERKLANQRTRQHLGAFRIPTPLRWVHHRNSSIERVSDQPLTERLPPADQALIRDLGFHFSGEFATLGYRYERWIGPDGAVVLETGGSKRFLTANFDDGHRISMWQNIDDGVRSLSPATDFLIGTADLSSDYCRMLEQVVAWVSESGAQPLYRWADPDLDLACVEFYLRYQVGLPLVENMLTQVAWKRPARRIALIEDEMTAEQARDVVHDCSQGLAGEVIEPPCRSCGTAVPVNMGDVASLAYCNVCRQPILATEFLYRIESADQLGLLIEMLPIALVVGFWSDEYCASVHTVTQIYDAVLRSDARFLCATVEVSDFADLAERFGVATTPTLIRFEHGAEVGRFKGLNDRDELVAFAKGDSV